MPNLRSSGPFFRLAREGEEIKLRTWSRQRRRPAEATGEGLTVARRLMHTGQYRLSPACLYDVGVYYCARDDRDTCLSGFQGRGALSAHLWSETGNKAAHVIVWLCRVHGPEPLYPHALDEPAVIDRLTRTAEALDEHYENMRNFRDNGGVKPAVNKGRYGVGGL